MSDGTGTREPAPVRIARFFGRPAPEPFTDEEQQAFDRWLAEGDARVAARQARSTRHAA